MEECDLVPHSTETDQQSRDENDVLSSDNSSLPEVKQPDQRVPGQNGILQPHISTFFRLPGEVRNIIYSHLVIRGRPMEIRTPRKKHFLKKNPDTTNFGTFRRVNKQIYAEANPIFHASNRIVVGVGHWGSTREVNLHGLRKFVTTVPAAQRAHITCATILLQTKFHTFGLKPIARSLVRNFQGLKELNFEMRPGPRVYPPCRCKEEREIREYSHILGVLMKHQSLVTITFDSEIFLLGNAMLACAEESDPEMKMLMSSTERCLAIWDLQLPWKLEIERFGLESYPPDTPFSKLNFREILSSGQKCDVLATFDFRLCRHEREPKREFYQIS